MPKNYSVEQFDEPNETPEMTKEEVLQNEDSLLEGLLLAAEYKNLEDSYVRLAVTRKVNGEKKTLFTFRIRPISDKEENACIRKAQQVKPGKYGERIVTDSKPSEYNSRLIVAATVNEDRAKIWGNKTLKEKYGAFEDWEMVDILLASYEKDNIIREIQNLSGANSVPVADLAKN